MKTFLMIWMAMLLIIGPVLAQGIGENPNKPSTAKVQSNDALIEVLKQQLQDLQKQMQQQKEQMQLLQQKLENLDAAKPATPSKANATSETVTPEQMQEMNEKVNKVIETQKKKLPGEFNPAIGLVGETIASYHTLNSTQTGNDRPGGFDVFQRSVELNLSASVDPFVTGYAVVNGSADAVTGQLGWQLEEVAAQTISLPGNLTLKGGRFFGEFGRLAYIHDHELPFVNRPLALDKYIGGESQTDGMQVSWLLPTEHYINLTLGLGDKFGDPQNNIGHFRSFDELNFFGRLSTYFDLTPDWQVETGVSGLFNPRTDDRGGALAQPDGSTLTERKRRLGGVDFSLRYVPLRNNQFCSFTWGTEVLYSDNRYRDDPDGVPGNGDEFFKSVGSLGMYSYLAYKMDREWTTGFSYDFLENAQNEADRTEAYSSFLTYAISHWNQLRLQYTHTDHNAVSGLRGDDAVFLQWTWIIGAHSHGWQQR